MDKLKTYFYLKNVSKRQMDYQKDTKNTGVNSYGQSNVSGDKMLINNDIYDYSYKKTEKLVTALYMVTDCMEVDDALKSKIRTLSVELLSYIHKLSHLSSNPVDKRTYISTSLMNIDEILSLIQVAHTIGFISEMNTSILKKELNLLSIELKPSKEKDNHFTFTLDEKMFDLPRPIEQPANKSFTVIKDKRTEYNMSFINTNGQSKMSLIKGLDNNGSNSISKKDRIDKILDIIKTKKALPGNEDGVSIRDVSAMFTDCSEKTIQRELNLLVSKGQIKKTGAKRWSRYQTI